MPHSTCPPRKILDALPWIIIAIDSTEKLTYISPDARERTRLGSSSFSPENWQECLIKPDALPQWKSFVARALSGETIFGHVLPVESASGATVNYTWAAIPLKADPSADKGALFVGQAGTAIEIGQTNISVNDPTSSIVLNALAITDLTGRIIYANASLLKMLGYDCAEEVLGRNYLELCENSNQSVDFQEALHREGSVTADKIGVRRDGSRFEMQVAASLIRNSVGAPTQIIACANDVSIQRRAEAALYASERRLSLIFNTTPDPQALLRIEEGNQLIFEAVNQSYSNEVKSQFPSFCGDIINRTWLEVVQELGFSDDLISEIAQKYQRVLQTKQSGRYEYVLPGKTRECFLEVQLKPVLDSQNRCTHIFWNAHDLSKQRKSERTLRDSESRLSLIFNASSDLQALYRFESDNRLVLEAANRSFKNAFRRLMPEGVTDFEGRFHNTVMSSIGANSEYLQLEAIASRDAVESGAVRMLELPLFTEQGQMILEVRIEPVFNEGERCSHILWSARDVTFRRTAEKEILRREEMYRLLFEQMPDGVFVIDAEDKRPIKFSESWAASLGYSVEEFESIPIQRLCNQEDYPLFSTILEQVRNDRRHRIKEIRFMSREGGIRRFELHVAPIEHENALLLQCIARDITEYSESQAQVGVLRDALAHVGRVGTMGEMATGLAHELNQPLAAMHLYANAAKSAAEAIANAELHGLLDKISDQSLRAGQIVRRMRAFVARSPSVRNYCDMNQLIREVVALLESDIRKQRANLELNLEPSLPNVWIDGIQIQQVVVNLMRNAIDAVSQTRGSRQLSVSTKSHLSNIEVSVSDTGAGIDSQMLDRLFQPFASSKASGLGLGLAICKTLIEAHGGSIAGVPNPDVGAIFRFTIPRIENRNAELLE